MLWLSIHPKYVDAILAGEKSIELRRRKPRISEGPALIYATSPRKELVSFAWIESVTQAPLGLLWHTAKDSASVTRSEFYDYFRGLDQGTALHLCRVEPFANAITVSSSNIPTRPRYPLCRQQSQPSPVLIDAMDAVAGSSTRSFRSSSVSGRSTRQSLQTLRTSLWAITWKRSTRSSSSKPAASSNR